MPVNSISAQAMPRMPETEAVKGNPVQAIESANQVKESAPVSKEKLEKVVASLNEFMAPANTHTEFVLHEKLNEYYVTVVDDVTREIVREIPNKKVLDMYAAMTEFVGLFVDKKS
ncbi:flagellar protein FlaG [Bacillus sp. FJAT-42376]|uniref:flagellar protein FlaG n=1 Tax=Bacillus sp. FJAT-42376 TaxID=2014076 RepID=UPI000F4D3AA8|nr:flagellar protein FlaG [Bacillus sp. FJAT-42376]AZB44512.1 flagellar protein FlaG [Bacillus sp. FJAT-42376]